MKILNTVEVCNYLNIDYDDEYLIETLIDAAELYLKNATGIEYDNTNPLAVLYCKTLISDWYDNRTLMSEGKASEKVRYTLQSILTQLQFSD